MKLRKGDRVLIAIAGLLVLALGGWIVAEGIFRVPLTAAVGLVLAANSLLIHIVLAAASVLLLALGLWCLCALVRRSTVNRGFVAQKTDDGTTEISVKAMEALVRTCTALHPEMQVDAIGIDGEKDTVEVDVRVALASGVSVPLAVNALQKQISQYIGECTGVEVRDVRVRVDSLDGPRTDTVYAVPELLPPAQIRTDKPEESGEDTRSAHQRIFGHVEEPVIVPAPPAAEEPEAAAEEPQPEEAFPAGPEEAAPEAADPAEPAPAETAEAAEPDEDAAFEWPEEPEEPADAAEPEASAAPEETDEPDETAWPAEEPAV